MAGANARNTFAINRQGNQGTFATGRDFRPDFAGRRIILQIQTTENDRLLFLGISLGRRNRFHRRFVFMPLRQKLRLAHGKLVITAKGGQIPAVAFAAVETEGIEIEGRRSFPIIPHAGKRNAEKYRPTVI